MSAFMAAGFRKFLDWVTPERPVYLIPDMLTEGSERTLVYTQIHDRLVGSLGRPPTTVEMYQEVFRMRVKVNQ